MYILTGFINPSFSDASFLVPIFSHQRANKIFVQCLDKDYRINAFANYDLEIADFRGILPAPTPLAVEVGDLGILGFQFKYGELIFGTRRDLGKMLNRRLADLGNSPFLTLEVCRFLGLSSGVHQAILTACAEFQGIGISNRWAARELDAWEKSFSLLPDGADVGGIALDPGGNGTFHLAKGGVFLRETEFVEDLNLDDLIKLEFTDPRWPNIWLNLYKTEYLNDNFLLIGSQWLSRFYGENNHNWINIWLKLVRGGHFDILSEAAMAMLRGKPECSGRDFVSVWIYVARRHEGIVSEYDRAKFIDDGLRGWSQLSPETSRDARVWAIMAKILLRIGGRNEIIRKTFVDSLMNNSMSMKSWSQLWGIVFANEKDSNEIINLGFSKIYVNEKYSRGWYAVWSAILEKKYPPWEEKGGPLASGLRLLGWKFLKYGDRGTNVWARVWIKMFEMEPNNDDLLRMGLKFIIDIDHNRDAWEKMRKCLMVSRYGSVFFNKSPVDTVDQARFILKYNR